MTGLWGFFVFRAGHAGRAGDCKPVALWTFHYTAHVAGEKKIKKITLKGFMINMGVGVLRIDFVMKFFHVLSSNFLHRPVGLFPHELTVPDVTRRVVCLPAC